MRMPLLLRRERRDGADVLAVRRGFTELIRRRKPVQPPNWWGWGWGPGRQETAEFKILEAYFTAAYGLDKRITEIMAPGCVLNDRWCWVITFIDDSTLDIYHDR